MATDLILVVIYFKYNALNGWFLAYYNYVKHFLNLWICAKNSAVQKMNCAWQCFVVCFWRGTPLLHRSN